MMSCRSLAPVAQLDRASASGAEGRGFESRLAHTLRKTVAKTVATRQLRALKRPARAAPVKLAYADVRDTPPRQLGGAPPCRIDGPSHGHAVPSARTVRAPMSRCARKGTWVRMPPCPFQRAGLSKLLRL